MISEIVIKLEKMEHIDKVHYFEGWNGYPDGNLIDFMQNNISSSDIFLPICTENMRKSNNCKKE